MFRCFYSDLYFIICLLVSHYVYMYLSGPVVFSTGSSASVKAIVPHTSTGWQNAGFQHFQLYIRVSHMCNVH